MFDCTPTAAALILVEPILNPVARPELLMVALTGDVECQDADVVRSSVAPFE
jgi:hypothetical protein